MTTIRQKAGKIYSHFVERELARLRKATGNPNLISASISLPFIKEDLAGWLEEQSLQGKGNGWICNFCSIGMTVDQLSVDHDQSMSFGGRTALDNFICCCQKCNQSKWVLSGSQYRALRILVQGGNGFGLGMIRDMLLHPDQFDENAVAAAIRFLDEIGEPWPTKTQTAFWQRWNSVPTFIRHSKKQKIAEGQATAAILARSSRGKPQIAEKREGTHGR